MKLLDTTVRDGSYVIDFQFSAHDTSAIAARLDDAGAHFIEVGHGLGLGAGKKSGMISADTDERYLEAAASAVKKNKWGMFFIPGIGTLEDIELAAKYKMNFIRIGTNVTEIESSKKFIEKAKSLGMYVFANYMKTYAASATDVGKLAKLSESYGADLVCVVDSAGGMMPEDVRKYVSEIKENIKAEVGFHGHNNLGLAVANSLIAVECGADVIDTSVRGMGRSSGNTVTEMFLFALKRRGIDLGIDTTKILNLAEKIIDPLMANYKQVDSIAIISGYAQFHSSFQPKIFEFASKYNIDPRELITTLTSNDRVNAPDELLEKLSNEIAMRRKDNNKIELTTASPKKIDAEESVDKKIAQAVIKTTSLSKKWGKSSVFNIVQPNSEDLQAKIFSAIHDNDSFVMSSGEFSADTKPDNFVKLLDGKVEFVLLDSDIKSKRSKQWLRDVKASFKKTEVIPYSDTQAWAESITNLVLSLFHGDVIEKKILITGSSLLSKSLHTYLALFGLKVEFCSEKSILSDLDGIIFCDNADFKLGNEKKNILIIDGIIGALSNAQLEYFQAKEINVYRPEMINVVLSKLESIKSSMNLVTEKQGFGLINKIRIAAGGVIAPRGTVIVDSVKNPAKVFGIANGKGSLLSETELSDLELTSMHDVEDWILTQYLN